MNRNDNANVIAKEDKLKKFFSSHGIPVHKCWEVVELLARHEALDDFLDKLVPKREEEKETGWNWKHDGTFGRMLDD